MDHDILGTIDDNSLKTRVIPSKLVSFAGIRWTLQAKHKNMCVSERNNDLFSKKLRFLCISPTENDVFVEIELSAWQGCCFSRYTHSMSFRKTTVPGEPLDGGSGRATTSMVMFSWYQDRIVSETDLLFLEIYRLKIFFEYRIYQEQWSSGGLPVNPLRRSCSPNPRFGFSGWLTYLL